MSQYSTLAYAMRDSLVAILKAEQHIGGRLAGLADVRKTAQFAPGRTPGCAVQLLSMTPSDYAQRRKKVTVEFTLIVATRSVGSSAREANLDDAFQALEPLIDDNGVNGVIPVLNDPANFGLGFYAPTSSTLASESYIGRGEFKWDISEGAQQSVWAYFELAYTAIGYTAF